VMRAWGGEVEQEVEVESVDREANEEGNLN